MDEGIDIIVSFHGTVTVAVLDPTDLTEVTEAVEAELGFSNVRVDHVGDIRKDT